MYSRVRAWYTHPADIFLRKAESASKKTAVNCPELAAVYA